MLTILKLVLKVALKMNEENVEEDDVIAVAYRIENDDPGSWSDDLKYGEFISELVNNSKTAGVLKLIKPQYVRPDYKAAWKLKMKNIYNIPSNGAQITDLDFDIYLRNADGLETNQINGVGFLELFGFDQLNNETADVGADGKADNRPNYIIEPGVPAIRFPTIEPFGKNIPAALNEFKYQDIYDVLISRLSLPENYFVIRGKYRQI